MVELSTVNAVLFSDISETTTGYDPELPSLILLLPELPTFTDPNSMLLGETVKPLMALEPRVDVSNTFELPQPENPRTRAVAKSGRRYRLANRATCPAFASMKEEER